MYWNLNKWGYEHDGHMEPLVELSEFVAATGCDADENAMLDAIDAASDAVRAFCGWHVSPPMRCRCRLTTEGRVATLPVRDVSGVESVTDCGDEVPFEWRRCGMVRRTDGCFSGSWDGTEVVCTAGTDGDAALRRAVCSIALHMLNASDTASSETADGVSVTYRQAALSERDMMALGPYRLVVEP